MEETKNLMDGLLAQIERAQETLGYYEEIPQGVFGATMIKAAIKNAKDAIKANDIVAMIKSFKELENIK